MSWSEILLIAVIGLIVIGPKDLPKVVKIFMQFTQKARALAREFQSGVEEMAREAELHEVKEALEKDVSTDFSGELDHSIDPGGNVARSLELETKSEPAVAAPAALPASTESGGSSSEGVRENSPSEESKDPIFVDALPAAEPAPAEVRAGAALDAVPAAAPKS